MNRGMERRSIKPLIGCIISVCTLSAFALQEAFAQIQDIGACAEYIQSLIAVEKSDQNPKGWLREFHGKNYAPGEDVPEFIWRNFIEFDDCKLGYDAFKSIRFMFTVEESMIWLSYPSYYSFPNEIEITEYFSIIHGISAPLLRYGLKRNIITKKQFEKLDAICQDALISSSISINEESIPDDDLKFSHFGDEMRYCISGPTHENRVQKIVDISAQDWKELLKCVQAICEDISANAHLYQGSQRQRELLTYAKKFLLGRQHNKVVLPISYSVVKDFSLDLLVPEHPFTLTSSARICCQIGFGYIK